MALRMIPFGYAMENGKTTVSENEAEIVRYIFAAYAEGKILREIAEELTARQVVFYEDKTAWNKNMVSRIISDSRYVGEKGFPPIVSVDLFAQTANKKAAKGFTKKKQSDTTVWLKTVTYCGVCKKLLFLRPVWKTREKWLCNSGCKYAAYIDDKKILNGIHTVLQRVKANPDLLQRENTAPTYIRTQEIVRYTNEIGRMLNESSPSFPAGKKLILECAAKKFCACTEDTAAAYTDYVLHEIESATDDAYNMSAFLKKIVDKITVGKDGHITVRFINGAEIQSEEKREDANAE